MIFDLKTGKRRRVVQIIFGFLAFIFFISFVGFGIGSEVSGGIFDAIGLGGSDSSSNPQYEQQIEDAEATLETDPENQPALLDLTRTYYLAATETGVTTNQQTGAIEITEESRTQLERSVDAWDRYLATDPRRPDVGAAANVVQAFVLLNDADGAAAAQEIVAESQNTAASFGQLAFYLYADGKIDAGDKAAERAVEAADPTQRKQIERNLDGLRKQAVKQQQAIEEAAQQGGQDAGAPQLEDPFGGLGGSSGLGAPAPAPAP